MMARKHDNRSISLFELLHGIIDASSLLKGVAECPVTGLALDSRDIQQGFGFVALQGKSGHGVEFCQSAILNGAAFILHDGKGEQRVVSIAVVKSKIPVIVIPDLANQLPIIIQRLYPQTLLGLNIVGITGTNGKTTCSQYIAQALNNFQTTAVIGTLGNGIIGSLQLSRHTTPDTITVQRLLNEFYSVGAKHVIMEVSSHGIEQGRVKNVPFTMAMFTNLTQDHLDYHGSMEAYGATKRKLFESFQATTAVINIDDPFGEELFQSLPETMRKVSYSTSKGKAGKHFVLASAITQNRDGMQISIQSSWGDAQLDTPLLGRFNASNLLGVLAVLLSVDIPITAAIKQLSGFSALPGRMQSVMQRHQSEPVVVVDYAHTPDALENVLQALRQHVLVPQRSGFVDNESQAPIVKKSELTLTSTHHTIPVQSKLWCVFGCGGDRDTSKRAIMGGIAQRLSDQIVLTDDNPRTEIATQIVDNIRAGFNPDRDGSATISVIHDRREAIRYAIQQANAGDIVVIAGKGHEDYQIIGNQKIDYPTDMNIAETALAETYGIDDTNYEQDSHDQDNADIGDSA
ncbi:MAG: Mur ligase family protein [Thiohalomonadales bacterium]